MRSKAVLFGINYVRTPEARLRGCVNDVNNMADYLKTSGGFDVVETYTDETNYHSVTGKAIINTLYRLGVESHRRRLERVWILFSGHGTSIRDYDGDECDRKDECILPSDYDTRGVITDDLIKRLLRVFHENTKVTCIFDCCHSGTIGDLKYKYVSNGKCIRDNHFVSCKANILMISGCKDDQTSADAYNVQGRRTFTGAMTSCLLLALRNNSSTKIFKVIDNLRSFLRSKRYSQVPQLTSSFELTDETCIL